MSTLKSREVKPLAQSHKVTQPVNDRVRSWTQVLSQPKWKRRQTIPPSWICQGWLWSRVPAPGGNPDNAIKRSASIPVWILVPTGLGLPMVSKLSRSYNCSSPFLPSQGCFLLRSPASVSSPGPAFTCTPFTTRSLASPRSSLLRPSD